MAKKDVKIEEKVTAAPKTAKKPFDMEKKKDGTIALTITIPWSDVEKVRNEIVEELIQHVELPGFRKGKAPRAVAEQKLAPERVREETLKKILTDHYIQAVKNFGIKPLINPLIHVETFTEGTELVFLAETCEEPEIELGDYKAAISKVTAKSKIIIPHSASSGQAGKEAEKPSLDAILDAALSVTTITIPKVLIDNESQRLLSRFLDEVKTLGMSLEQYLSSKNITSEQLKAEYEARAEQDLKLEFFLRRVSDAEKITVEPKDIEEALGSIENQKEREEIAQNPYLVASIIRQQKTLDFLSKI